MILKSSIEFHSQTEGSSGEQLADSSSKHAARDSSLGRLFHDAVATAGGQFRVSWQSEYTASQIQTPEDALKAVKLYRRKRQRFSGLKVCTNQHQPLRDAPMPLEDGFKPDRATLCNGPVGMWRRSCFALYIHPEVAVLPQDSGNVLLLQHVAYRPGLAEACNMGILSDVQCCKDRLDEQQMAGISGTMNRSKCAVGMQGKHIEAVVVTGDQVTAYAALALGTAVKKMRPVSKQENLGPKRIARCGWGGGTSPLEALSIQLRNQR